MADSDSTDQHPPTTAVPPVDPATRAAERHDEHRPAGADRLPTPEEEQAAERAAAELDPDERARVKDRYEEMAERGASTRGEGRIED